MMWVAVVAIAVIVASGVAFEVLARKRRNRGRMDREALNRWGKIVGLEQQRGESYDDFRKRIVALMELN